MILISNFYKLLMKTLFHIKMDVGGNIYSKEWTLEILRYSTPSRVVKTKSFCTIDIVVTPICFGLHYTQVMNRRDQKKS